MEQNKIAAPAVDAAKLQALPVDAAELDKLVVLAEAARESAQDAVAEALGDAYDCTRVWSAWGYGTMGEDDFVLITNDSERVAEIADAAIDAVQKQFAALVAQQAARIAELERDRQLDRDVMKAALVDLYQRMEKSYDAEPTRRITFMDMEAAHEHVARLGFGGSLDAAIKEGK